MAPAFIFRCANAGRDVAMPGDKYQREERHFALQELPELEAV
jgi:hypothetical protein